MKKFFATILAILYLATTTGATIHMHYCMDKLVELNLWHSEKDQCNNCGMETSQQADNGCCKDEHKQVKLENDHYKSGVAFQAVQSATITLPVDFLQIPLVAFSSVTEENPRSNAPPRSCGLAIYKRNCVFRI